MTDLDSDTMSTWYAWSDGASWRAEPHDPVHDDDLEYVIWHGYRVDVFVIAATRRNAIAKAIRLAKRQGVGG